eukprot:737104-Prorocentrum_minimum.AAC.1
MSSFFDTSAPPPTAHFTHGVDTSKVSLTERQLQSGANVTFLAVTPSQIPQGCPGLNGTLTDEYSCQNSRFCWNMDSLALPRFVGKIVGSHPSGELSGEDVTVQVYTASPPAIGSHA